MLAMKKYLRSHAWRAWREARKSKSLDNSGEEAQKLEEPSIEPGDQ